MIYNGPGSIFTTSANEMFSRASSIIEKAYAQENAMLEKEIVARDAPTTTAAAANNAEGAVTDPSVETQSAPSSSAIQQ